MIDLLKNFVEEETPVTLKSLINTLDMRDDIWTDIYYGYESFKSGIYGCFFEFKYKKMYYKLYYIPKEEQTIRMVRPEDLVIITEIINISNHIFVAQNEKYMRI